MSRRSEEGLRSTLANEAARLMAEEGIRDFGLAKRKAAERLGAGIRILPRARPLRSGTRRPRSPAPPARGSTPRSPSRRFLKKLPPLARL